MNLKKLKESARKHEQKEDWQKAIKVYLRAIEASESGLETVPDLSLYNRVGDLYMKVNDTARGVKTYEKAVDLYADQGFANNAIAICGKILRVDPGRMQTYLTLAKLYARKNFVVDAKMNLLEYLDRMNRANRREHAFSEVSGFAEQFRGEAEIREMLRELVQAASRDAHSTEQLDKLAAKLETDPAEGVAMGGSSGTEKRSAGRPGDLIFLDTSAAMPLAEPLPEVPEVVPPKAPEPLPEEPEVATPTSDLPLLDLGEEEAEVIPAVEDGALQSGADLEVEEYPGPADAVPEVIGEADEELEGVEPTAVEFDEGDDVDALEGLEVEGGVSAEERAAVVEEELDVGVEPTALDAVELESVPIQLHDLETTDVEHLEPAPEADEGVTEIEDEIGVDTDVPGLEPVGETIEPDQPLATWEEDESPQPLAEEADETAALLEDLSIAEPTGEVWERATVGEGMVESEQPPEAEELSEDQEPVGEDGFLEEEFEFVEEVEVEPDSAEPAQASVVSSEPGMADVAALEERLANTPNDPFAHRALGEGLIVAGSKDRGLYELELALAGFENRQDWGRSMDVLREVIRLDPNRIWYYQKRVELAYRSGEKPRLVDAYLELGDVLVRVGSLEKALAVYGRVLEHDPANEFAQAALDVLQPVKTAEVVQPPVSSVEGVAEVDEELEEETPEDEFVDLGALVLGPKRVRDTRIRIQDEPTGDEERDFEIMLEQFKAALEESLTDEDYQAHYDLGVAFKEMGLLDEAIAEFQKALRAPEGRLRTSEALGVSFYEKGQYAVAEAILRRAVDGISGLDDEKIGLLYWLGRSTESLGQVPEALGAYERALAVDVGFMDINDRIKRLTAGLG